MWRDIGTDTSRMLFVIHPPRKQDCCIISLPETRKLPQRKRIQWIHGVVCVPSLPEHLTICRRTCRPQYIDRYYTSLLLTNILGLTPAMFVDEANVVLDPQHFTILDELESSPDPDAGLYIRTRSGKIVKVAIPKHCLAFQTGEGSSRSHIV